MPSSKPQRWLDLLAVLVGPRVPISIDQIMERVPAYRARLAGKGEPARATVRRMFERDKDELRRMGIPLETRRYRMEGIAEAEGYLILRRDFYLPYLKLLSGTGEKRDESPSGFRMGVPPLRSPSRPLPHSVGQVTLEEADAHTAILALRQVLSLPSFPFQREARSALRKLTYDLDPALDPASEGGSTPALRILDRPGGADLQGALGVLLDGLYDRRRVAFRYHSIGRDAVEPREVEPWGIFFQWGAWYLVAHDPSKNPEVPTDRTPERTPHETRDRSPEGRAEGPAARLFRVDRMAQVRLRSTGAAPPDFQVPEDFDVRAYAGRKAWELGREDEPGIDVSVRFFPPASLLAERNGWGEEVDSGPDGSSVRRFAVRKMDPFLRWTLSMAGEAEVLHPPDVAERLAGVARSIAERHGGGG